MDAEPEPDPAPGHDRLADPMGPADPASQPAPATGPVDSPGLAAPPDPGPDGDPASPPSPQPASPPDPDLVELALASVELSPEGLEPATGTVSLVDLAGGGRLDIVMARSDAMLVQEAIAGTAPPRPRTHELLLAAVGALDGAVDGITMVERRAGGVYVASLRVRRPDGSTVELDARPSDALNVALRSAGAGLRAVRSLVVVPAN